MTRYSVHPRNRMFVKSYEFLPFAKNMEKNIAKNSIVKNFLIMPKNLQHMRLKLLQKESFRKQRKQPAI